MNSEFQEKVVVVTGGSRGIGKGIALGFAKQGAQTVLAAQSSDNLAAAAKEIASSGAPKPLTVAADLRTLEGCEMVFEAVMKEFKRCDVLVNNAGAAKSGNILGLDEETWQDGFALKFFGCVRLCRLFWPLLVEVQGHVINIVGGAARTPSPDSLVLGAVNAAMSNFTKGLSGQGKRDGVQVNAILPGITETDRVIQLHEQQAEVSGLTPDEVRAERIAKAGLRRLAQPEDMANLALFLCSKAGNHIQGTAIAVDGGAQPGYY